MLLRWFDSRQATEAGIALADHYALEAPSGNTAKNRNAVARPKHGGDPLRAFLQAAERTAHGLSLNFYKKAKLANAFKWRLVEKGIEDGVATAVTQTLVMHLSMGRLTSGQRSPAPSQTQDGIAPSRQRLRLAANKYMVAGDYEKAATSYQDLVAASPHDAVALNMLGVALHNLGKLGEGEEHLRRAIRQKPKYAEAHANLGTLLRTRTDLPASEQSLRHALKLKPNQPDARASLGLTLLALGQPRAAKPQFERVLAVAPRHIEALLGMGRVATTEGRFEQAERCYRAVLAVNPESSRAWASLVYLRTMTRDDSDWLRGAEQLAAAATTPYDEANLRFAIGKYYDDVGDYSGAFHSYERANEIQRQNSEHYDSDVHKSFVDDLIRVYTPDQINQDTSAADDDDARSTVPIFVVGMPRAGTSLVEQIIASHPDAEGAGELDFWAKAVHTHQAAIRREGLGAPARRELARAYLQTLHKHCGNASRIVDKAPINSDYLGIIHGSLPRARIIYVRRNPMDTCLSCYFQQFTAAGMNFSYDLSDLAHYWRQHHRLIDHWRSVLPSEALLTITYEDLVADPEANIRRMLAFIGLDWDERCLQSHKTERIVATASSWQVRQKLYRRSLERWRKYEKYLGPLRNLRDLDL